MLLKKQFLILSILSLSFSLSFAKETKSKESSVISYLNKPSLRLSAPPGSASFDGSPAIQPCANSWLLAAVDNKSYIWQGGAAGVVLAIPTWLALIIKDRCCGIVLRGGPEFHGVSGFPPVAAISAAVFAALSTIYKVEPITDLLFLIQNQD